MAHQRVQTHSARRFGPQGADGAAAEEPAHGQTDGLDVVLLAELYLLAVATAALVAVNQVTGCGNQVKEKVSDLIYIAYEV